LIFIPALILAAGDTGAMATENTARLAVLIDADNVTNRSRRSRLRNRHVGVSVGSQLRRFTRGG